jgi:hypothetical protein
MAKIGDVLNGQIAYLRTELLTTYKDSVDFEQDWKMLTVLIGMSFLVVCCCVAELEFDMFLYCTRREQPVRLLV